MRAQGGHIEVICGPMFSGKTEELIRRLRRAQIARQRVLVFKPKIDDRYDAVEVVSHSRQRIESIPVENTADILAMLKGRNTPHVVAVDEAQFFDETLPEVCEAMADRGIRVICAGLDLDYMGKPFGCMPALLSVAESVTKQLAVCIVCGDPAARSQRVSTELDDTGTTVLVGAHDAYEARCRGCFVRGVDVPASVNPASGL